MGHVDDNIPHPEFLGYHPSNYKELFLIVFSFLF